MSQPSPPEPKRQSKLRLGSFGATRSGKTVYLTTLYWLSKKGRLPDEVSGLWPADANSAQYLGDRYAMIEAGRWPVGNIDSQQVALDISLKSKVVTLTTNDFRGGDFTAAFYGSDTSSRRAAEEFVRKLFNGCSAYIFLVDCGEIRESLDKQADLGNHETVANRSGAIEIALGILRRRTWNFPLFHPPVTVVLTKGDLHPECMANPQGYAKQHLRPVWDYLQKHARSNHEFFAITSTGTVPPNLESPPLPLQPSENFFEPILWCVQKHSKRLCVLRSSVAAVVLFVMCALWFTVLLSNRYWINGIKSEIRQDQDDQLQKLYTQVQGWQGWSLLSLTHRQAATKVLQKISAEAENRLRFDRRDSGDLRTVDDFVDAQKKVTKFVESYRGTEEAARLSSWITTQRQILGKETVSKMREAAETGDERKFKIREQDYAKVASSDLDHDVEQLRRTLDEKIVEAEVKSLWQKWKNGPRELDEIRAKCQDIEKMLKIRSYKPKHHEFVRLMRKTYDQLKQSQSGKISFYFTSDLKYRIDWHFKVNGDDAATSHGWLQPVELPDGRWKVDGESVDIDLLKTNEICVDASVNDKFPVVGTNATLDSPPYTLQQLSLHLDKPVPVFTNKNEEYRIIFQADEQLSGYCRALARIKELGVEFFESAK